MECLPRLRQLLGENSNPGSEFSVSIPAGHNRVRLHVQDGYSTVRAWTVGTMRVVLDTRNPMSASGRLPVVLATVAPTGNTNGYQNTFEIDPGGNELFLGWGAGTTPDTMVAVVTTWAEGL